MHVIEAHPCGQRSARYTSLIEIDHFKVCSRGCANKSLTKAELALLLCASEGSVDRRPLLPLYPNATAPPRRQSLIFQYNNIGLCLNNTRSYLSFLLEGLSTNRHSLCGSRSPSPCWLLPAMHLAWLRRTNTETRTLDNQDTCEQSTAGGSAFWSC